MNKIILFYWVPGSCGDIVKNLLNFEKNSFEISQSGRSLPATDTDLITLFPWDTKLGWYNRQWSQSECQQLVEYQQKEKRRIIIGTHSQEQLLFLKNNLGNQAFTMGITYSENLYPSVIKNWCKKCAANDYGVDQVYSNSHPVLSKKFKNAGIYDQFILQEILRNTNNTPLEIENKFEHNISLGKIFNRDLSDLSELVDIQKIQTQFDQWFNLQDPLYRYKFPVNDLYVDAVGYNFDAQQEIDSTIKLTALDHVLIRHYCKVNNIRIPIDTIATNIDLVNFLNVKLMQ